MCLDVDYCAVGYRTPNCGKADALFCFLGNSLPKGLSFQVEVDREYQGLCKSQALRSPIAFFGLIAAVDKPLFDVGVCPDSDCSSSEQ